VPLPWSGDSPPYGFTTGERTWLPQPANWSPLTVSAQDGDDSSMLGFYRRALAGRPTTLDTAAPLTWNRRDSVLDITVAGSPGLRCVVNFGDDPVALPAGDVLLASAALTDGTLPPDAAAWLTP
jgi:alpha-glucosidase